jgi:hypothetical protein
MADVLKLVRDPSLCPFLKSGDRKKVRSLCGDFPFCDVLQESGQVGPRELIPCQMVKEWSPNMSSRTCFGV